VTRYLITLYKRFRKQAEGHASGNENPQVNTNKNFAVVIEILCLPHLNPITMTIYLNQTCYFFVQIKMKQTPETEHELVESVPDIEIPTNSEVICRPCQIPLDI